MAAPDKRNPGTGSSTGVRLGDHLGGMIDPKASGDGAGRQAENAGKRLFFAPVPARAVGDLRLTVLHMRVLACVAMHDRMSARGKGKQQGCWAGNQTLAAECGCNYSNLSTALTDLGRFGYLERIPHPLNRRLRVYQVLYNEADEAFTKAANTLPRGKQSPAPIVCPEANGAAEIVCPETGEVTSMVCPSPNIESQNQGLSPREYIPRSGEDTPLKRGIDFSEAARIEKEHAVSAVLRRPNQQSDWRSSDNRSAGGFLAQCERLLKSGQPLALGTMQRQIEEIRDSHEVGQPVHGWAERLLEQVQELQP